MCSGPLTSITRCLRSYQPQSSENRQDIFFLFVGARGAGEMLLFLSPELSPDGTLSLFSFRHAPPCAAEQRPRPADCQWAVRQQRRRRRLASPHRRAAVQEEPDPLVHHCRLPQGAALLRHQQPGEEGESRSKNLPFLRSLKVKVHPNTVDSVILAGQIHRHVPQPAAGRWHVGQSERVPEGNGPLFAQRQSPHGGPLAGEAGAGRN